MLTISVRPLLPYLAAIADPRKARGLRHPLLAILALCCVAMLSGAKNPKAIANWRQDRQGLGPFLQRLGFRKPYGPGKSTLYRVLALVPCVMLETQLTQWIEENLANCPPPQDGDLEGVAIDGKTLRGSRKQGADKTHLLGAFTHCLGLMTGQVAAADKTNEIGVSPDLLAELIIAGRVFTMDALLAQREIAQTIVEAKGDYVMIVKENQPTLHDDIATLFADPDVASYLDDEASTKEKGHGRLETRVLNQHGVERVSGLAGATTGV